MIEFKNHIFLDGIEPQKYHHIKSPHPSSPVAKLLNLSFGTKMLNSIPVWKGYLIIIYYKAEQPNQSTELQEKDDKQENHRVAN